MLWNQWRQKLDSQWDRLDVFLGSALRPFLRPRTVLLEANPMNRTYTVARYPQQQPKQNRTMELVVEITLNIALAVATAYVARRLLDAYLKADEGDRTPPATVHRNLQRILKKRGQTDFPELDSYETQMADVIVDPDEIDTGFSEIGGLDQTKQEIYELAVLPLVHPEIFTGKLVQPCKGILLYGKPGTGKTMMAKALAKESQAVFIPLQLSRILNKWVGESNKLIAATFRLAHKLQPAIIFIDEVDTFLKANSGETGQFLDTIKSEFLILWDGVTTSGTSQVLVLGATNQPHAIDPAIQRRMPRTFLVPLPDVAGREAILNVFLKDEDVDDDARSHVLDIAKVTAGYSGSDLKELCKAAAMVRVQERSSEYARKRVMGMKVTKDDESFPTGKLRSISREDLVAGFRKVGRTGAAAQAYGREVAMETQREQASVDRESLQTLTKFLRTLSTLSDHGATPGDGIPNM